MAKGHEKNAYGNKNYGDKCTKFEFMNNGWPYNIIVDPSCNKYCNLIGQN